jgi:Icc-related predicted phosphoesterase
VLITHGPAWRILDYVPYDREHVGCFPLAQRIDNLENLKAHICGHIHESYGHGTREKDGVRFVNACTCDSRYRPINPPIIIDV